jgi:hypothetical protein
MQENYENLLKNKQSSCALKPFMCNIGGCEKKFKTKGNLKVHLNIHIDEKRFNCTFLNCRESYIHECRLAVHMRTHVNYKFKKN